MTIAELIREANRIDNMVVYEVTDMTTYKSNSIALPSPVRTVTVSAFKSGWDGSLELIALKVNGDQVRGVIAGKTNEFWQVWPLQAAFEDGQVRSSM